jgi:hypothetical protein
MIDFIRNHRIATIVAMAILVLFIWLGYVAISRIGKEPVFIHLVPSDTVLMVGDKRYGSGTAYISPGTYNVEATRDGFETYKASVTIDQPNETAIDLALTPVSEEALQWQRDNIDLYMDHEGRSGQRAVEFGTQFQEQNPITAQLPFRNYIYSVGYKLEDIDNPSKGIVLVVTAITGYRQAALDKIRELGFEPTDYKINFKDYENPFSHE